MDFLYKAFDQVRELFRSMTVGGRITTALLLATLVVSLFYLFRFQSESVEHYLFGARVFSQREIETMAGAFSQAQLNEYELDGFRIKVPRGKRHDYIAALHEYNAMPQHPGSATESMFASDSPFSTGDVREAKLKLARETDLANTISRINGIEEAYVTFEQFKVKDFPPRTNMRAVVFARAIGNEHLSKNQVRAIRDAAAYAGGAKADDVSIVDLNSSNSYSGGEDGMFFPDENPYAAMQSGVARQFKEMIEKRLSYIPGLRVEVFVELDKTAESETMSQTYDGQPIALQQRSTTKESTSSTPQNQGRPGPASNQVTSSNQEATLTSLARESTSNETQEETQNVAGTTQRVTREIGPRPKYVKASVGFPKSYVEKVWRQENPTAAGEDPVDPDKATLVAMETTIETEIQDVVEGLMPELPPGEDPFPLVRVAAYHDAKIESPPGPSLAETTMYWFGSHWQTIGLFLMSIAGLLMVRSMIRSAAANMSAAASEEQVEAPEPAASEDDEDDQDDDITNSLRARFQASGRSLRDELTELVREDPDAAANVLQNWIGEAA